MRRRAARLPAGEGLDDDHRRTAMRTDEGRPDVGASGRQFWQIRANSARLKSAGPEQFLEALAAAAPTASLADAA